MITETIPVALFKGGIIPVETAQLLPSMAARQTGTLYRCIFGFELEHLRYHREQLVRKLASNTAFHLRLVWKDGQMHVYLLVRALSKTLRHLHPVETELRAIMPVKRLSKARLATVLHPFPHIVELRQTEDLISIRDRKGYIVYPFHVGAFSAAYDLLRGQPAPVMFNIHLEPTQLHDDESRAIMQSPFARSRHSQAHQIKQIYENLRKRLITPYMLVMHIASPDPQLTTQVATAIAHNLAQQPSIPGDIPVKMPHIAHPQTDEHHDKLRFSLSTLTLTRWGDSLADDNRLRLRYLVDAETAVSLLQV